MRKSLPFPLSTLDTVETDRFSNDESSLIFFTCLVTKFQDKCSALVWEWSFNKVRYWCYSIQISDKFLKEQTFVLNLISDIFNSCFIGTEPMLHLFKSFVILKRSVWFISCGAWRVSCSHFCFKSIQSCVDWKGFEVWLNGVIFVLQLGPASPDGPLPVNMQMVTGSCISGTYAALKLNLL